MNVISLFDGISCGMLALQNANIKVNKYYAFEIDENAIKISSQNYPQIIQNGNVFENDFSKFSADLLIGGSPCTFWSSARTDGKRETIATGLGADLFNKYAECLNIVKPKYFLYENNNSISKNIKDYITHCLGVKPCVINSAEYSAQNRKRVYWTNIPILPHKDENIYFKDVIDFSDNIFKPVGFWVYNSWGDKRKIDTLKKIDALKSSTLTTSKTHPGNYYLSLDKKYYTNLTIEQWEILQTLPKGYVNNIDIKESYKYKAIGNGWTVKVISHIFKGMEW